MVAAKSPDWLPSGWIVQVKVKNGRKIKCFSNLETGQKFYSKNDVLHCVEMGNGRCDTTKPMSSHNKKPSKDKSLPAAVKMDESPKWLPDGWTLELKTRKTGSHMGTKYKCYIDPDAGRKFYSKPEVLQYLKTVKQSSRKAKWNKRGISPVNNYNSDRVTRGKSSSAPDASQDHKTIGDKSFVSYQKNISNNKRTTKDVVVAASPDGLPPGWIKEIKPRKYANGIKKDPYYTDPVSGYTFRSKLDVSRYLETGDINSCAIRPKKRDDNHQKLINNDISSQSPVDKKTSGWRTTRRQLFAGGKNCETSSLSAPEAIGSKKRKAKGSESNQDVMVLTENGSISTHILQLQKTPENVMEKHSNRKTQVDGSRSKNKQVLSLPTRFSKRRAGLKPEMLANLSERALRAAARKSGEAGVILDLAPDTAANGTLQQRETEPGLEIPHNVARGKEVPSVLKPLNRIENSVEGKDVSEEKLTSQETEKQDSKRPESRDLPFCNPSGDSWSDPCLEFAFKTLTGAIPLPVEGHTGMQGFYQQQLDPAQTQRDGSIELPKFDFQNDVSFGFDSTEECLPIQQLPTNPIPPPVRVSQPSCSSIESQQPSLMAGTRNIEQR